MKRRLVVITAAALFAAACSSGDSELGLVPDGLPPINTLAPDEPLVDRAVTAEPTELAEQTVTTLSPAETVVAAEDSTVAVAPPATTPASQPTGPQVEGRYTIAQVIDGTVGSGDGSNPNDNDITGLHDVRLPLTAGFGFGQGPIINPIYGNLAQNQYVEWRCGVFHAHNSVPTVDFRINLRGGAYYQFANGNWTKAFDAPTSPGGAFLGNAGGEAHPYDGPNKGGIQWRQEADGSISAPWNRAAKIMHFWAGQRQSPLPGQTAEFLTSEFRIQQPDGQQVDLSQVKILAQCGPDYYNTTGGQGTKVPGPGIGKYHLLTEAWTPSLYLTLPSIPSSTADFERFLSANPPPGVS